MDTVSGDIQNQILSLNALQIMASTILVYDNVLTLPEEIKYIWSRPSRLYSISFLAMRYGSLLLNLYHMLGLISAFSTQTCATMNLVRSLLLIVNILYIDALLLWRIYAIYHKNNTLLVALLLIGFGLGGISTWSMLSSPIKASSMLPLSGCHIVYSRATAVHLATSWEALLIWDTIMLLLTVRKTYTTALVGRQIFSRPPLMLIVLRDGALYFVAMALANLGNILSFYFAPPLLRGSLANFATCISASMMARLMLNIQSGAGDTETYYTGPYISWVVPQNSSRSEIALSEAHAWT